MFMVGNMEQWKDNTRESFLQFCVILSGHCTEDALYHTIVCVEVLRPFQPNGVMSNMVSLPNHRFTGQA